MQGIYLYSKLMEEKLVKNQPSEIIIDAFMLGFIEGKNQQRSKKFPQILDLISSLRQLINLDVYELEKVMNIYNQVIMANGDLEKLCQQLEIDTFENIEKSNKQKSTEQSQQIQPAQSLIIMPQQIQQKESQKITQPISQPPQKSIIKQSNQPSIIKQLRDQKQSQQNINLIQYQQIQQQIDPTKIKNPMEQASGIYKSMNNTKDLRSIQLARQLQLQLDEDEAKRLAMLESQAAKNLKIWCSICLDQIQFEDIATLYCLHIYHRNCLNKYCINKISSKSFPIICPGLDCKKSIIYPDLLEVLDIENLEKFYNFTFQHFVESHGDEYSWCPTPNCQYVFVADNNLKLNCPLCENSYCLQCKTIYHLGLSCQQYIEKTNVKKKMNNEKLLDAKFLSFVNGSKFKQCPQCKFWVEKIDGCNHMTCICKFQFCYRCGGVYKQCACYNNQNQRFIRQG